MKTPAEKIAYKRRYVPVFYQKLFDRCIDGQASPREAIKMHCLECWAYVRHETATCDNVGCPLWTYRPYQPAPPARQNDLTGAESTNEAGGML